MTEGRGIKKAMLNIAAIAVALFILPRPAAACGSCVFGMFEYGIPHITQFCLGISVWFLAVMTAVTGEKDLRLSPQILCHLSMAVVFFLLAWFIAAAYLGPLPFIVLGMMAFSVTVKAWSPSIRKKMTPFARIALTAVSVTALFCLVVWAGISAKTKSTRSDADFVLHWSGYQGRAVLKRLIADKDTVQLRQILAQTENEYLAREIAEALAEITKKPEQSAEVREHP